MRLAPAWEASRTRVRALERLCDLLGPEVGNQCSLLQIGNGEDDGLTSGKLYQSNFERFPQ